MTVYAPDDNRDNEEGELRLSKERKELEDRIKVLNMILKIMDGSNLGIHR